MPDGSPATAPAPLATLTIDVDAVVANWRLLARQSQPAECAAVMKADGYGLGTAQLAPALAGAGCRTFFVAHAAEGAALRAQLGEAGHAAPRIFILHGVQPDEADFLAHHRLIPVLSTMAQVELWRNAGGNTPLPAALQVDSGMNRLGLSPAALQDLVGRPAGLAGLNLVLLLSHLACADEPANPMNARQRELFLALRRLLPDVPASLANSAAIFHGPGFAFDLVRPGIALYGVDPIEREQAGNPLRPVVDLRARILQIREIDPPEAVGYGFTFHAARRTRLATVSAGYADGYLRALSNQAFGAIDGVRVPLVGRVSMDLLTFDISDLPPDSAREGSFLELAGPTIPLGELARHGGTIGYELLTRLGSRLLRRYRKGGDIIENAPRSLPPIAMADMKK